MIGLGDSRATIVAIASATSPALRGIVRLAGDDAIEILQQLVDGQFIPTTRPFQQTIELQLGPPLGIVDATALVWPTASSYTGCPSVEIHTYGCLPILEAIVAAAVQAGARPAGPGEFTMRAFLTGRLDLTQAEAVLGVIDATNPMQLDLALTQLAGNVSVPLRQAREQLLNMLADLEAGLDFVEEDISFIDDASLREGLESIALLIETTAHKMSANRRSESHHWVVLRGQPNAGKSSLLNALAGQPVAIVSDQAGTTRDVVWQEVFIDDYRVRLADTAGIEITNDQISVESQHAAAEIEIAAKIVLQCCETVHLVASEPKAPAAGLERPSLTTVLQVATKADTINPSQQESLTRDGWIVTSAITGAGLSTLRDAIKHRLEKSPDANDGGVVGTAARCRDSIDRAAKSLRMAQQMLERAVGQELVAAEMREALAAIGEVTGEVYTDDILDRVFSRFCIGK